MNNVWLFLGVIGLYILCVVYCLIKASQKEEGRIKFELKKTVNYLRPSVHLIWAMYFILWGVLQVPAISEWSLKQIVAHPQYGPDTLTYYGYATPPYIAILTIFVAAIWFMRLSAKPWIKYSEQEQEWLKEENDRLREKVQKWFGRRVASLVK